MTQTELATAVGMTHKASISAIEVGRNVVPVDRYFGFSEALGIAPDVFFRKVLQLTNPWGFAMLFSKNPKADIAQIARSFDGR